MPGLDLKAILYRTGILPLYHRIRNRETLTVIMFHRVLDPSDPRWRTCDPDYTISTQLFTQCLELLVRHYAIVSLEDVLRAREAGLALPSRALLITFDDGWQDNFQYALPVLGRMRLPAALFVVGAAVNRGPAFFQEQLIAAWRRKLLGPAELRSMSVLAGITPGPADDPADIMPLRRLIAALEALSLEARQAILSPLGSILEEDERYFLSTDELRGMLRGGVRIGAHGMTHTPLTKVNSVAGELLQARERLSSLLGEPPASIDTLSCPHGKFDAPVVKGALEAGYKLVFTSHPALNAARPVPPHLLARVGFEASFVSDANDRLRPGQLALYLFRRPIARLA